MNHQTSKTVKLFKLVHCASRSKRAELGLTIAAGVGLASNVLANKRSSRLVQRIVVSESLMLPSRLPERSDIAGDKDDDDQY